MKIAYKSSPVKLRAKTPSRYDLKYDNVSKLCFKHTNVIFLYVHVRKIMKMYVCVKASVIAIKRARKEEKQRRRRKKGKDKRKKRKQENIFGALCDAI